MKINVELDEISTKNPVSPLTVPVEIVSARLLGTGDHQVIDADM